MATLRIAACRALAVLLLEGVDLPQLQALNARAQVLPRGPQALGRKVPVAGLGQRQGGPGGYY